MKNITILLGVAALATTCANDINLRTASHYAQGCQGFQAQNERWKAQTNCGRAATNADLGRAPDRARAALWYEYGRTSGAICDYVEGKRGLNTALSLDEKVDGPAFMSLLELGRLHLDQAKYKEAAEYFQRFDAVLPQEVALKEDPIGYADVLEEYARASEQSGDALKATALRVRSQEIRKANPLKSSNTDRTTYGKYCDQKS
jgi:hypothetical protein